MFYYLGRKYTPLYEKGIKKDQNKLMETTVIVVIFIIFSVKFTMLTYVVVNFSVMFTDFGSIHSVILILSSK